MVNGLAPPYLQTLLPARHGQNSTYPTRRENSFIPVRTHTNRYYRSFIPTTIKKWNTLETTLKTAPSINTFKNALKKSMFTKSVGYYSRGHGQAAITHTRIRLGLSPLKHQLYSYSIANSPNCTLCNSGEDETAIHYFMKCTKHVASRYELLQTLRPTVDRLGMNTTIAKLLVTGHPDLTSNKNVTLSILVQDYIKNTKDLHHNNTNHNNTKHPSHEHKQQHNTC